jgi:uncharacterized cupin superfamily protein
MTEARLIEDDHGGRLPATDGWFVVNARETAWVDGDLGASCVFESRDVRFAELGINLNVLQPGQPMTMYHREDAQEDFLVLAGDCVLIVEGEERRLRPWDFFHCPPGIDHAIVGAGDGPSLVLAVGARHGSEDEGLVYPADPVAQRHGAAVETETSDGDEAYAGYAHEHVRYQEGWLPEEE